MTEAYDEKKVLIAAVIADISVDALDRPFEYIVPEELCDKIKIGSAVKIPFGRGNRELTGYVTELKGESEWELGRLKTITAISEREVSAEGRLIGLAAWLKKRYGGSMNQAIKTVLPMRRGVKSVEEHWLNFLVKGDELSDYFSLCEKRHYTAKLRLLEYMQAGDTPVSMKRALSELKINKSVVDGLVRDGIISVSDERLYRMPTDVALSEDGELTSERVELTDEQKSAVDTVISDYEAGINKNKYLLYGVTGSGKTEVYIRLISHVLERGRQAIVLIPEIALTHQTVIRLSAVFGDRVSVMHSRLSAGERYDQYERVLNGEVDILVGPRSAVFTPFSRLGLIIIDEEHEQSYISEQTPSYNAIEVAIKRAADDEIPVILGSATPSAESYKNAMDGKYKLLRLNHRARGLTLPRVYVADMREELRAKNHSVFSRLLAEKIRDRLEKKEQTMLFINRRGYAGFVSCRSCGYVVKCPHCDVSMTAHLKYKKADLLMCHYCGNTSTMPNKCPECGSPYIAAFGLGTQKVAELVNKEFPTARVLRMDADTTKNKDGHERVLAPFREGEADILVGTQMIVKGHDLKRVTLVGAIAADLSLFDGDYKSSERTFQLLSQAGGRAGRASASGEFVIQTYRPEEYCIEAVKNESPDAFYERELGFRRLMGYPPYCSMLRILVTSVSDGDAKALIEMLGERVADKYEGKLVCIGPARAAVSKVKDKFRWVLYIKSPDDDIITENIALISDIFRESNFSKDCRIAFSRGG